jgi:hypothetical protein
VLQFNPESEASHHHQEGLHSAFTFWGYGTASVMLLILGLFRQASALAIARPTGSFFTLPVI